MDRATLVSTGEHLYAVHRLGSDYTDEAYVAAVELGRAKGFGEAYADTVLGKDGDAVAGAEGEEVLARAMRSLSSRGISDPSYRQLADELVEVSS